MTRIPGSSCTFGNVQARKDESAQFRNDAVAMTVVRARMGEMSATMGDVSDANPAWNPTRHRNTDASASRARQGGRRVDRASSSQPWSPNASASVTHAASCAVIPNAKKKRRPYESTKAATKPVAATLKKLVHTVSDAADKSSCPASSKMCFGKYWITGPALSCPRTVSVSATNSARRAATDATSAKSPFFGFDG